MNSALAQLALASAPARRASITDVTDTVPSIAEIARVLTFQAGYNTTLVVLGTTLLGIAAGLIGTFALLRKRALMADALSHATLPGIVLAFIVLDQLSGSARSLPLLLAGGAATGVLGIWTVQLILQYTRLREDAAIGIVLSCFFGIGIALLSIVPQIARTSAAGLNHFIYGQAAAINISDVALQACIAALAIASVAALSKEFSLISFNDAFARATGWPVSVLDLLLMSLVVLVTITGLQSVGLLLIVAMLIIPPAAARFWSDRLRTVLISAALFGGVSAYLGASISALLPRKPTGAVIVLTAGSLFLISMFLAPKRGVVAQLLRHLKLKSRVTLDHFVESAYERSHDGLTINKPALLQAIARDRGWTLPFTRAIHLLTRLRNLTISEGDSLRLTSKGIEEGRRIARNHYLWEQYLISFAEVAPTHVDWSVDQVEHVLDDHTIAQLERALLRRGITVPQTADTGGVA